jgi:hypothetical protein
MKRFWLILVAMLGLAVSVAPASADVVYTLAKGGSAFPTPGNYGTITLHQVGTGTSAYVQVTVQLKNGAHFQGGGAGYAIAWNLKNNPTLHDVNSSKKGVTIETANTPNSSNFAVQNYTSGQQYKAAPFTSSYTNFMYAIDYTKSGSTGSDTKLVFDVYNKNVGVQISDFIPNSGGYMFAVDIWDDINNCGVTTGNVAAIPEPGTSLLLLAGLIGVPLLYRRRKLARA